MLRGPELLDSLLKEIVRHPVQSLYGSLPFITFALVCAIGFLLYRSNRKRE